MQTFNSVEAALHKSGIFNAEEVAAIMNYIGAASLKSVFVACDWCLNIELTENERQTLTDLIKD